MLPNPIQLLKAKDKLYWLNSWMKDTRSWMMYRFIRSYACERIEKWDSTNGKHDKTNHMNIKFWPSSSQVPTSTWAKWHNSPNSCNYNRNLVPKIFSLDLFMLLQKCFYFWVNEVKHNKKLKPQRFIGVRMRSTIWVTAARDITNVSCSKML